MRPSQVGNIKLRWMALLSALILPVMAMAAEATEPSLAIEVKQFKVEGDNPLSSGETEALLQPYLGRHSSLDSLEAAPVALEAALRKKGYVFHRVVIPAQKPENGEVRLKVVKFALNALTVSGNQHFSSENILRSLPDLKTGESPDV